MTTISASAYLGVVLRAGGSDCAFGALLVLVVNVSLLILSGSLTWFLTHEFRPLRTTQRGALHGSRLPWELG